MTNFIHTRFSSCLDSERVRNKITVRPASIDSLNDTHPLVGAEVLANSLKQIYIPNQFSLLFINEMLIKAYMHQLNVFSSEVEYTSRIYNPPEVEVSPVCLTGLAGVGKSNTVTALRKVMPEPTEYFSEHCTGPVTLVSHWYASARGKLSGKGLLCDFLSIEKNPLVSMGKLLLEARRRANRDAVSLVLLDETQHINTGSGSVKVTDILLTMAAIGPPMVYLSNYSLVHKLLRRNSEDKQRSLSDPRIMLPDEPDSKDWKDYIDECVRVSGGHIRPSSTEFAAEVYRCTFGIKRLAVLLLKQAYVECRNDGRLWVELSDLGRAYRSAAFTSNASEVEELHLQALNSRQTKRLDLCCPFDLPVAHKSKILKFVRAERQSHVVATVFDSALTSRERAAKNRIEKPTAHSSARAKQRRKPVAEKQSEVDQAKAFFEYLANSSSPGKPKKLDED